MQLADFVGRDRRAVRLDDPGFDPGSRTSPTDSSARGSSDRTAEIPGEHSVIP